MKAGRSRTSRRLGWSLRTMTEPKRVHLVGREHILHLVRVNTIFKIPSESRIRAFFLDFQSPRNNTQAIPHRASSLVPNVPPNIIVTRMRLRVLLVSGFRRTDTSTREVTGFVWPMGKFISYCKQ